MWSKVWCTAILNSQQLIFTYQMNRILGMHKSQKYVILILIADSWRDSAEEILHAKHKTRFKTRKKKHSSKDRAQIAQIDFWTEVKGSQFENNHSICQMKSAITHSSIRLYERRQYLPKTNYQTATDNSSSLLHLCPVLTAMMDL